MSSIYRQEVLKLYKQLMNYGKALKYTDQTYFKLKVREVFEKNK